MLKFMSFSVFHFIILIVIKRSESYSKVIIAGNENMKSVDGSNGPTVHRSLNMDLLFPKVFNETQTLTTNGPSYSVPSTSSSSVPSTSSSTGRAFDSSRLYPAPRVIGNHRPYPLDHRHVQSNYVYPVYKTAAKLSSAEIHKLHGTGEAMDRYTPGEAVASSLFKKSKPQMVQYNLKSAASSVDPAILYQPPPQKDLYSFPPNHSKYPSPSYQASSTNQVSSYSPPAAGPVDDGGSSIMEEYAGPISPEYLPTHLKHDAKTNDSMAGMMDSDIMPESDDPVHDHNDHDHDHDHYDTEMTYPTPPPNYDINDSYDHDHDDMKGKNSMMIKPMMPAAFSDSDHPPFGHDDSPVHMDHESDHPHHYPKGHSSPWSSFPNFYGSHDSESYPELIYDDHDHPHDYHHHPVPTQPPPLPPLPATTPEPPPEPRVKKYSYFYLGRKLWYIPLYFTVWFSFYVLWLILKSIARHKVNIPNHYQARSLMKRSLWYPELSHKQLDQMTISVMGQIDKFKANYL